MCEIWECCHVLWCKRGEAVGNRRGGGTLFAMQSHNPLVVYKAFQFAIILAKILVLFLPRPLSYGCNDFGLLFLYSSHIVPKHARARAGSHLCTRLHHCTHGPVPPPPPPPHTHTHTQVHSTFAHTRLLNPGADPGFQKRGGVNE